MKLLRYICLLLSLAVLMAVVGCKSESADKSGDPFFQLIEDVTAPAPEADAVKHERFNPDYTDTLTASEEYGELIPFVGAYYTYKSVEEGKEKTVSVPVYGLCTLNGAVVVDAVYDAVKQHPKDEGGFVYELVKGCDGSDPTLGERYVAASDGSWVFKMPKNCSFFRAGGERIILERTKTVKKVVFTYHDFYDYKGKCKFTFDTKLAEDQNTVYTIGEFHEGMAPVNITVTSEQDGEKEHTLTAYYIDNNGKKLYDGLTSCTRFENGYAVAVDENGLYGVLDTKGKWFIEAKYRIVNYNPKVMLFACADEGFFAVFNQEKEQVKKVFTEKGNVEMLSSDWLIYKKTNPDTGRVEYFYADNDEPFTCLETGQFPDGDAPVEGLYVCVYSGTGTIFNIHGDSIVSIGDFGELADRFNNTAVVVNANGKKTCFVTISTQKRTEWMRYRYMYQSVGDRYLVMQNPDTAGFGLYDLTTSSFVFEECDYIEAVTVADITLLSVVSNGNATVYDSSLSVVLTQPEAVLH